MRVNAAITALLSALAFVAAAPTDQPTTTSAAVSAGQTHFKFPLANGFPNIKNPSPELRAIEEAAVGIIPNFPLARHLSSADITNFQLIAFAKFFEVAYFTSLISNITNNVPGYQVPPAIESYLLQVLNNTVAQEQLHALSTNAILKAAGSEEIQPCEYIFPFNNFFAAIDFVTIFTDVIMGTLQDFQQTLALHGDSRYIPWMGSVMGSG